MACRAELFYHNSSARSRPKCACETDPIMVYFGHWHSGASGPSPGPEIHSSLFKAATAAFNRSKIQITADQVTQSFHSDEMRMQTSSVIPGELCITFKASSSMIISGMSGI